MAPGFPIVILSAMSSLNLSRVIRPSHNSSDQVGFLNAKPTATTGSGIVHGTRQGSLLSPRPSLSQSLSPCPPGGEWYLHVGQNAPDTTQDKIVGLAPGLAELYKAVHSGLQTEHGQLL